MKLESRVERNPVGGLNDANFDYCPYCEIVLRMNEERDKQCFLCGFTLYRGWHGTSKHRFPKRGKK